MRRCPKRVNFRMTEKQFDRYQQMIGALTYVHNWTDLCLKALEELANKYKGTWSFPLMGGEVVRPAITGLTNPPSEHQTNGKGKNCSSFTTTRLPTSSKSASTTRKGNSSASKKPTRKKQRVTSATT